MLQMYRMRSYAEIVHDQDPVSQLNESVKMINALIEKNLPTLKEIHYGTNPLSRSIPAC
jgi:hypothetical protein